ncbi:MAG: hypothetical protein DRP67_01680 [Candidatus Omnitrophota bacterium]|nr:MAG: hypothetical protein DRP67_01680 [Candidatus Omnitrophota bacterium]
MIRILCFISAFLFFSLTAHPEILELKGKIKSVTIYPYNAEIKEVAVLNTDKGDIKLKIGNISPFMVDDSLRVNAPDISILTTKVKKVFLKAPGSEKVKEIEEKIEKIKEELKKLEDKKAINLKIEKFLENLGGGSSRTPYEKKEGLLEKMKLKDVKEFIKFMRATLEGLYSENQAIEKEEKALRKQLDVLKKELNQLKSMKPKERKEVIIEGFKKKKGESTVEITYLVRNVYWRPFYRIGVEEGKKIKVEFMGEISQNTGVDWENTKLILSTAPSYISATIPHLTPIYIEEYKARPRPLYRGRILYEKLNVAKAPGAEGVRYEEEIRKFETGVSFVIPEPKSVPSMKGFSKVFVRDLSFEGKISYISAPKISPRVYMKASIKNTNDFPVLPGNCLIFHEGNFVGRGYLNMILPGQKTDIPLGYNPNVKIERKLVKKFKEEGGFTKKYIRTTYAYRIKVQNYMEKEIELEVYDQIPVSRSENIRVKLVKIEPEPQSFNKETGIFKWKDKLSPQEKKEYYFEYYIQRPEKVKIRF